MKPSIDVILQSLTELTKKKVKRNAKIWSTRINELLSVKNQIIYNHIPVLSRHFLNNNLLHDQNVQLILKESLPLIISKRGLSIEDFSLTSYVYSCIDEDLSSENILSNNFSSQTLKSCSDHELLIFLRTLSLIMSRKTFGSVNSYSGLCFDISNDIFNFLWNRVKFINTKYMSESVEYLSFSEILIETIFISNLIGRLPLESLTHNVIDYGSLFSRIKISHLLGKDKLSQISDKINFGDHQTVLDTLRKMFYNKFHCFQLSQNLFNRLCNTPAKSTMCRKESLKYLDYEINEVSLKLDSDSESGLLNLNKKELLGLKLHLESIRNSRILENPHRSRVKWNYPCFLY